MIASVAASACVPSRDAAVAPGTRDCIGLPPSQCEDVFRQADETARQRGTTVLGIVARCVGTCSPASGEAELAVTYGDGTTERSGFGWQVAVPAPPAGPPAPEPEASLPVAPTCVGLDSIACRDLALGALGSSEPDHGEVVSIVVRCTPGPCTPTAGDGETTITYADGTATTVGWGYENAP
jgi:hypothetical protein